MRNIFLVESTEQIIYRKKLVKIDIDELRKAVAEAIKKKYEEDIGCDLNEDQLKEYNSIKNGDISNEDLIEKYVNNDEFIDSHAALFDILTNGSFMDLDIKNSIYGVRANGRSFSRLIKDYEIVDNNDWFFEKEDKLECKFEDRQYLEEKGQKQFLLNQMKSSPLDIDVSASYGDYSF